MEAEGAARLEGLSWSGLDMSKDTQRRNGSGCQGTSFQGQVWRTGGLEVAGANLCRRDCRMTGTGEGSKVPSAQGMVSRHEKEREEDKVGAAWQTPR